MVSGMMRWNAGLNATEENRNINVAIKERENEDDTKSETTRPKGWDV